MTERRKICEHYLVSFMHACSEKVKSGGKATIILPHVLKPDTPISRHKSGALVHVRIKHQTGEVRDPSDLDHGMVVGTRCAGLGYFWDFHSLAFIQISVRVQSRMSKLVQDDRKATLTRITTLYNRVGQKSISESTTCRTLRWMSCIVSIGVKEDPV